MLSVTVKSTSQNTSKIKQVNNQLFEKIYKCTLNLNNRCTKRLQIVQLMNKR